MSLNQDDVASYLKLNKPVYYVTYAANEKMNNHFCLRNKESLNIFGRFILSLKDDILNFTINNGINKLKLKDLSYNKSTWTLPQAVDNHFDIILQNDFGNSGPSTPRRTNLFSKVVGGDSWSVIFEPLDFRSSHFYIEKGYTTHWLYRSDYLTLKQYKIFNEKWGFISDYIQQECRACGGKTDLGLVVSFINLISGEKVVTFNFQDVRTLEELKKISQYKIDAF